MIGARLHLLALNASSRLCAGPPALITSLPIVSRTLPPPIYSLETCLKTISEVTDIYGLCEKTASHHSGQLRVPGPLSTKRRQRRGSQVMSPLKETEEELQSIREDIERAVFGRRQSEGTSCCRVCNMSEPNCVLLPCMHSFACHSCTTVLRIDNCPICQTTLNGYQKI